MIDFQDNIQKMAQNLALMTIISIAGIPNDVMSQEEKRMTVAQTDLITDQMDSVSDRLRNTAIDVADEMVDQNMEDMRFLTEDELCTMDPEEIKKIMDNNQNLLDENQMLLDGIDGILNPSDPKEEFDNDYSSVAPAVVNTAVLSM